MSGGKPAVLAIYDSERSAGGDVYERMVVESLVEEYEVVPASMRRMWMRIPLRYLGLGRGRRFGSEFAVTIRTLDAVLLSTPALAKSVTIVHHLDFSQSRYQSVYTRLLPMILRRLRQVTRVVVVSRVWQQKLADHGVTNVSVIYNGFNLRNFLFDDSAVEAFKQRLGLTGKPVVYLGTGGPGKGVERAYHELRGLDAFFVSSGVGRISSSDVGHLWLPYSEYLLLLKAATVVVTMSEFDEGWCRTAHEAMLCKTPVVGSGRGGMRELLEAGRQTICDDFGSLRAEVERLLTDQTRRREMGEAGFMFTKDFTVERFRAEWLDLIGETCRTRT